MSSIRTNPDVIVIGAGTAGLSAAAILKAQGREVLVLEADSHVGGRCVTDHSVFGKPFDRGGSWLHSAEINPLATLAEKNGFPLHKKPWEWKRVHTCGRLLNDAELAEYAHYQETMWDHVRSQGAQNPERSVLETLPKSQWKEVAKHWVPQLLGGDADAASSHDVAIHEHAEGDWLVGGGLGAFVKYLHRDIEVMLDCPVSEIDYSGPDVKVSTLKGELTAKQVVITVSTGVLAAEAIKFIPQLPIEKLQAVGDLPNGLLNKIGIDFDPVWTEVHEGYNADYHAGGEAFCCLQFGFFGSSLAVGFTSGRFGKLLEEEGEGAATEFCLQGLKALFGNDAAKYVRGTTETMWASNTHTLGSYSYAKPGCAEAREILAEPINNRLFFAGEATIPQAYATVHGAYLSGKRAAREITKSDDQLDHI